MGCGPSTGPRWRSSSRRSRHRPDLLANANNFSAVYPKEIAEKYPTPAKVTEYIGTGPFKFVEWKPDVHIRMVRYDDYKPRTEAANGYGGERSPTSTRSGDPDADVATRVASLESAR